MKSRIKKISIKVFFFLLFGLIFFGIEYAIALFLSHKNSWNMQDVLAYEGLVIVVVGVFMSMKGNPSGLSMSHVGRNNAQYISYENLEVTRQERELTNYHKNFLKHSIVEFSMSSFSLILSGILILILSML